MLYITANLLIWVGVTVRSSKRKLRQSTLSFYGWISLGSLNLVLTRILLHMWHFFSNNSNYFRSSFVSCIVVRSHPPPSPTPFLIPSRRRAHRLSLDFYRMLGKQRGVVLTILFHLNNFNRMIFAGFFALSSHGK